MFHVKRVDLRVRRLVPAWHIHTARFHSPVQWFVHAASPPAGKARSLELHFERRQRSPPPRPPTGRPCAQTLTKRLSLTRDLRIRELVTRAVSRLLVIAAPGHPCEAARHRRTSPPPTPSAPPGTDTPQRTTCHRRISASATHSRTGPARRTAPRPPTRAPPRTLARAAHAPDVQPRPFPPVVAQRPTIPPRPPGPCVVAGPRPPAQARVGDALDHRRVGHPLPTPTVSGPWSVGSFGHYALHPPFTGPFASRALPAHE